MGSKRLPPMSGPQTLEGLRITHYTIGSWRPPGREKLPPTAVGMALHVQQDGYLVDLVLRLKTPQAVDTMIQSLLRHKRNVWPDAS